MWGDFSSKLTKIKHNFVFWSRLVFGASMKWKNWKKKFTYLQKWQKTSGNGQNCNAYKTDLTKIKNLHSLIYLIIISSWGQMGLSALV